MPRPARLITLILVALGASAVVGSAAQARTVCGTEPAVGVVYRIAAVRLSLQITGHFQDNAGDHQDATLTMNATDSHVPFNYKNFGDFGGCPGNPPTCVAHAPICRGDWWSSTAAQMTTDVKASWYDSGSLDANPPSSSTCHGSYQGTPRIDSAWRVPLYAGQGNAGTPRRPKLAVGAYVQPQRLGGCVPDNVEVLGDIVSDVLNKTSYARTSLAMNVLWHAGRHFVLPVNVTYIGPIRVTGTQYYNDPGATTTVNVRWRGSISFVRAYTCTPNGCAPPQQLPPAGDEVG